MSDRSTRENGFGLVEVVIAMFLLLIIAVALLPALVNGIKYSSQQSAKATATRHINALVEQARDTPTCAGLANAASSRTISGPGSTTLFTSAGTVGTCTAGSAVTLRLMATAPSGLVLATASALVYIP